jgi:hypothetical protein
MARRSPIATSQTAWPRQSRVLDGPRDGEVTRSASFAVLGNPEKQDQRSARGAFNPRNDHKGKRHQMLFVCGCRHKPFPEFTMARNHRSVEKRRRLG